MYQHMRLYEFSASTKLLLTGFIVAICAAGALGVAALQRSCEDADGVPGVSFADIRALTSGADRSVLERAMNEGLGLATESDADFLRQWCIAGAPEAGFPEVMRILKDTRFDAWSKRATAGAPLPPEVVARERKRITALARRHEPLSSAQLATGTMLYLSLVSLVFLGIGLLFVRTSLFEKTKLFFVSATFLFAVACPVFFALARRHTGYIYAMLLSALLLAVGIGVFAVVALYDLWFRRPVA